MLCIYKPDRVYVVRNVLLLSHYVIMHHFEIVFTENFQLTVRPRPPSSSGLNMHVFVYLDIPTGYGIACHHVSSTNNAAPNDRAYIKPKRTYVKCCASICGRKDARRRSSLAVYTHMHEHDAPHQEPGYILRAVGKRTARNHIVTVHACRAYRASPQSSP